MKKFFFLCCLLVLLAGAGIAGFAYYTLLLPPDSRDVAVSYEVKEGSGLGVVARDLEHLGLIRSAFALKMHAKIIDQSIIIKAGVYSFAPGMLPLDILEKMVKGDIVTIQFSIPEGLNMWQISEKLSAVFPKITKQEWLQAMKNPKLRSLLPAEATTVEGYLFPETYTVRPNATSFEIIEAMLKMFEKNLTADIISEGTKLGLSKHMIVTLASIIEKETGKAEERPHISSVFHNRLKKKMRLETDPTVIYGIWEKYDGNIRKSDLLNPTPYNTYAIKGLPPGPIASPGKAALSAAVKPLVSKDIFFVAKGDGSHIFAETLSDHNKNVLEYQIKPARKRARATGSSK
jgi:UPF0755 protein